jgi:hypothetical protein
MEPGEEFEIRLRLTDYPPTDSFLDNDFKRTFDQRIQDADQFFSRLAHRRTCEDGKNIQRQAFAGMLWNKQFYHYDINTWLKGDPAGPPPPEDRWKGRNHDWTHLYNEDIISMPDKWEYPWYAAWDLAFHCLPLAQVDPDFAKEQLILMLREWYMHPNGQIPAYEWRFDDVNPPLHAWAAWRVYKIEKRIRGTADRSFLERIFLKLLLNFTWWVNRKDPDGYNVFQGGFLGLDNIGLFDRSEPLPNGGVIEQSDGTSWMGMYCLNMMAIALELAKEDPSYADIASKFFEHFVYIADAMNNIGHEGLKLWDEEDGFYYDVLHLPGGEHRPLKVRSMVGLIPLFAVETLEPEIVDALPGFKKRMLWFIENRPRFGRNVNTIKRPDGKIRRLLSIVGGDHLPQILRYMLDENEFLSPFGIRALSRYHREHPFTLSMDGNRHEVSYEPAESNSALFGGNSNWRGPVWFPVNYLIIESLQKYHHFYGDTFKFECPGGSGKFESLWNIAGILAYRLNRLFLQGADGTRPAFGQCQKLQTDRYWRDNLLFHEYFHGDNGTGLGAMHQTGWTGLIAKLIEQYGCGTMKDK